MSTSEQLEREADQCRAQIADTLEELRTRITPGEVVDQIVDYARDGGAGEFLHNLRKQVTENPLPIALVVAGIGWMMMGTRRSKGGQIGEAAKRAGETVRRTAESLRDKTADAAGRATDAAQGWADSARSQSSAATEDARESGSRIGEAARSAANSMKDAASSAYQSGADAAEETAATLRNSAGSVRDSLASGSHTVARLFEEQPLVLAGLGLALGAALGAALPSTETEDALMGGASDEMKGRAQDFAGEQYDKAKSVAEHAYHEGSKEAEKQGLGSGSGEQPSPSGGTEGPSLVPSNGDAEVRQTDDGIPEDARANR